MSGITISKKYGVNPSVEVCHICGKEMGVVLFGTSFKDENGKTAEAPRKVSLGHTCDECSRIIKDGGVFFIEVRDGERGSNPYRTGRLWAVKKEAADRVFPDHKAVNFVEQQIANKLFGEEQQ